MMPKTLGELKKLGVPDSFRSVRDEIRSNLIQRLHQHEPLFPGILGFEESVVPEIVNALLARQDFILLGLRGQAKSRILRALSELLDEEVPIIAGSEIHDDPFFPISDEGRRRVAEEGDDLPVEYISREERFVEKLATPDVTVADIIGDIDPIKAAREGRNLSAVDNIHFGLLPRAHRGIFAMNELPDLAPKIQVALFNILQEGDVQVKGFPVRLSLDVLMVFSANPEDYTARGKIITPLKDRIGAEVRTHYPAHINTGVSITDQEAWTEREGPQTEIPRFIREIVEAVAFLARESKHIDRRSGVSQRMPISALELAVSNAERRALLNDEERATVRVADVLAALPAITGKLELEYEGELKGSDVIARELVERAIKQVFRRFFPDQGFEPIIQWFDLGGEVRVSDEMSNREYFRQVEPIQGLDELLSQLDADPDQNLEKAVSTIDFILEGLCANRQLSRSMDRGYYRDAPETPREFRDGSGGQEGSFN